MKSSFAFSALAAVLVSGCVSTPSTQPSTRRTLFDTAQSDALARARQTAPGASHARPARIDERPLALDDVGPAGRVRPKPSAQSAVRVQQPQTSNRAPAGVVAPRAPAPARAAAPSYAPATPHGAIASAQSGGAYRVHTVQSGETALGIAIANSMTLDQLKALNPEIARNPDRLRVGQGVKVMTGAKPAPKVAERKPAATAKNAAAPTATAKSAATPAQTAKKSASSPSPARDVEAPPKAADEVKVADTGSSIEDVLATGLAGAKDKARAEREEAEKAAREKAEAEKKRLEEAQKAAEEARRQAEEAKKQAQETAAKAAQSAKTAASAASSAVSRTATAGEGEYVVQPGDDIFSIALKFDVMPLALRKANGSDLSDLKVGQVLKIPSKD